MSLDYLSKFPVENIVSLNFKNLQLTFIMGLIMFKFLSDMLLDKKRTHMYSFLMGFFQPAIRSQVLMNPRDSETRNGDFDSSVSKQRRVDPILRRGDAEIVLESLGLISNPHEAARLDIESHEIFSHFEEKQASPDEVKDAFDVFDSNRDGFIDSKDLQRVLCSLGLGQGFEMDSFDRMVDVFDKNGDGRLDFEEFVKFLESSL